MQDWLLKYYVGQGVKKPEKIRKKIDSGKLAPGVYLVTLSDNPGNLLEIFSAVLLMQKPFAALCPRILGMAMGKEEALEMASQIIMEVYGCTGTFCIKEYFKNR